MHIAPANIVPQKVSGSENMGTVGDRTILTARFALETVDVGFGIASILIRTSGGSDGVADLKLIRDDADGSVFDFELLTWEDFGIGANAKYTNIFLKFHNDEFRDWLFLRNKAGVLDHIVLEWANPNTQDWAIEARLFDMENLIG